MSNPVVSRTGSSGEARTQASPGRLLLPALSFMAFLVGMEAIVTVPLIPEMARSTGMPVKLGGMLVAGYALAYALFAPVTGVMADRLGRRTVLLSGLLLFGLATALVGVAGTFTELVLYRILTGIGAGMVQPNVFAAAADAWPYERRGRVMGIITGSLVASSVLGIPLGGLLAEFSSWRWTFWGMAMLVPVAAVLAALQIPARPHGENASPAARPPLSGLLRAAAGDRAVLASLGASALFFGGLQGMFSQTGAAYRLFYGLETGQISLVLMTAGVASVIGSVAGGRWADARSKGRVVMTAALAVSLMILSFSLFTRNLWWTAAIQFVWASMYGAGHSALNARISELRPESRGMVLSLNASAMYVGSALLSFSATWLFQHVGLWPAGLLCAAANWGVMWLVVRFMEDEGQAEKEKNEWPERT